MDLKNYVNIKILILNVNRRQISQKIAVKLKINNKNPGKLIIIKYNNFVLSTHLYLPFLLFYLSVF